MNCDITNRETALKVVKDIIIEFGGKNTTGDKFKIEEKVFSEMLHKVNAITEFYTKESFIYQPTLIPEKFLPEGSPLMIRFTLKFPEDFEQVLKIRRELAEEKEKAENITSEFFEVPAIDIIEESVFEEEPFTDDVLLAMEEIYNEEEVFEEEPSIDELALAIAEVYDVEIPAEEPFVDDSVVAQEENLWEPALEEEFIFDKENVGEMFDYLAHLKEQLKKARKELYDLKNTGQKETGFDEKYKRYVALIAELEKEIKDIEASDPITVTSVVEAEADKLKEILDNLTIESIEIEKVYDRINALLQFFTKTDIEGNSSPTNKKAFSDNLKSKGADLKAIVEKCDNLRELYKEKTVQLFEDLLKNAPGYEEMFDDVLKSNPDRPADVLYNEMMTALVNPEHSVYHKFFGMKTASGLLGQLMYIHYYAYQNEERMKSARATERLEKAVDAVGKDILPKLFTKKHSSVHLLAKIYGDFKIEDGILKYNNSNVTVATKKALVTQINKEYETPILEFSNGEIKVLNEKPFFASSENELPQMYNQSFGHELTKLRIRIKNANGDEKRLKSAHKYCRENFQHLDVFRIKEIKKKFEGTPHHDKFVDDAECDNYQKELSKTYGEFVNQLTEQQEKYLFTAQTDNSVDELFQFVEDLNNGTNGATSYSPFAVLLNSNSINKEVIENFGRDAKNYEVYQAMRECAEYMEHAISITSTRSNRGKIPLSSDNMMRDIMFERNVLGGLTQGTRKLGEWMLPKLNRYKEDKERKIQINAGDYSKRKWFLTQDLKALDLPQLQELAKKHDIPMPKVADEFFYDLLIRAEYGVYNEYNLLKDISKSMDACAIGMGQVKAKTIATIMENHIKRGDNDNLKKYWNTWIGMNFYGDKGGESRGIGIATKQSKQYQKMQLSDVENFTIDGVTYKKIKDNWHAIANGEIMQLSEKEIENVFQRYKDQLVRDSKRNLSPEAVANWFAGATIKKALLLNPLSGIKNRADGRTKNDIFAAGGRFGINQKSLNAARVFLAGYNTKRYMRAIKLGKVLSFAQKNKELQLATLSKFLDIFKMLQNHTSEWDAGVMDKISNFLADFSVNNPEQHNQTEGILAVLGTMKIKDKNGKEHPFFTHKGFTAYVPGTLILKDEFRLDDEGNEIKENIDNFELFKSNKFTQGMFGKLNAFVERTQGNYNHQDLVYKRNFLYRMLTIFKTYLFEHAFGQYGNIKHDLISGNYNFEGRKRALMRHPATAATLGFAMFAISAPVLLTAGIGWNLIATAPMLLTSLGGMIYYMASKKSKAERLSKGEEVKMLFSTWGELIGRVLYRQLNILTAGQLLKNTDNFGTQFAKFVHKDYTDPIKGKERRKISENAQELSSSIVWMMNVLALEYIVNAILNAMKGDDDDEKATDMELLKEKIFFTAHNVLNDILENNNGIINLKKYTVGQDFMLANTIENNEHHINKVVKWFKNEATFSEAANGFFKTMPIPIPNSVTNHFFTDKEYFLGDKQYTNTLADHIVSEFNEENKEELKSRQAKAHMSAAKSTYKKNYISVVTDVLKKSGVKNSRTTADRLWEEVESPKFTKRKTETYEEQIKRTHVDENSMSNIRKKLNIEEILEKVDRL